MIMTKLYPIGTQLITRRLSQISLYSEIFEVFDEKLNPFVYEGDGIFEPYEGDLVWWSDKWCVIVTEDNQPWLSPVPMVGDKVQYHTSPYCSDKVTNIVSIDPNDEDIFWVKDDPSTDIDPEEHDINVYQITHILRRAYPNGQRAPLIEWDEVILPETKGE
jgi:hypothetical protein